MIYDRIENISTYAGLSPRLRAGLELLRDTDFSKLPTGKYEVDGANLYYSVQSYVPKQQNDTPEAHRKYIDIQYMVEGEEMVGIAPLCDMTEEISAKPDKDAWLYHGETVKLPLKAGCFMVLFPQDAHAPGIAVSGSQPVRKIVVKVLAE